MGECGCDTEKIGRIPGPRPGSWYVLEVHPGCTNGCGTEISLGVAEVEEGSEEWDIWFEEVPVLEFSSYRQWGTHVLDTEILKRAFMAEIGEDDDLADAPFALEEFVNGGGLREVFYQTRAAEQERATEYAARVAEDREAPSS